MADEVVNVNNPQNDGQVQGARSPRQVTRTCRYERVPNKLEVPYPAPLPEFSPQVEHYLQTSIISEINTFIFFLIF